ncbi:Ribonuclease HI [Pseudomonas syringae pv. actinidiae]|uniref:Ribonuclease HI n=1 Tax=Pseudomonas syringae pv. actinidiae TaxID=103796 RepID=A0A2V0QRC4_PSESF|nr:Ribonuclease HI [Pseudomonas syringae pv. actinidiae]GBH15444.1 Ribonuclease HI [Pseudomonas syringae pv. actinidiae]
MDVGDSQVVAVRQRYELNAFWCFDVGQVNDRADFQSRHVYFDELRQIFRQAGNFQLGSYVRNFAAFLDRRFFADEVYRYDSGQFLTSYNAYEVSVQHVAFGRVTLQCLDDDVLLGATNVQLDDVAVRSLVLEQLGNFLGQHADGLGGFVATVDYSWNQASETTQAAARTFPQVGTQFGIQGKIVHVVSPN